MQSLIQSSLNKNSSAKNAFNIEYVAIGIYLPNEISIITLNVLECKKFYQLQLPLLLVYGGLLSA